MKNKFMRLATMLMVLTLMTSCFVGSTFAKYVSTVSASDTARVAQWAIEVNNNEISVDSPTITFDLFETINDTGASGTATADADVDTGKIIAPGTEGQFEMVVENLSEVNAQYTIKLEESNDGGIPLQYSVNKSDWYDSIAELNTANDSGTTDLTAVAIAMKTGTATRTVYWRWEFNDTDSAIADGTTSTSDVHAGQTNKTDTALGIKAHDVGPVNVTITATITVEQVD